MNRSVGVTCLPPRPRPPMALTAVIATTAAVLIATACGGSPSAGSRGSSNAPGSSNSALVAFAQCMRSNGVPNFPDPGNSYKFPGAEQLGVSTSQYQAAYDVCKQQLPNGGNAPSQAELQQEITLLLPFARCMRSHGAPDWPDPSIYTNPDARTAVVFDFIGTSLDGGGFDSPQVQAAINECQHLLPPSNGGPPFLIVRSHR